MHDLVLDGGGAAGEWPLPGQELVEDDAGGEEVGPRPDRVAQHLLGRHVAGRAEQGARHGACVRRALHAGDAEVGQLDAAGSVQHHVGRLHVAVHHAVLVREGQRVQQLAHDAAGIGECEGVPGVEGLQQFAAAHELHHDVGEVSLLAEVEDGDDVGVAQAPGGHRLALEALGVRPRRGRVGDQAALHGLDRHRAAQARVGRLVDHAHRAFAEHPDQLVAAQRSRRVMGKAHRLRGPRGRGQWR